MQKSAEVEAEPEYAEEPAYEEAEPEYEEEPVTEPEVEEAGSREEPEPKKTETEKKAHGWRADFSESTKKHEEPAKEEKEGRNNRKSNIMNLIIRKMENQANLQKSFFQMNLRKQRHMPQRQKRLLMKMQNS